MKLCVCCLAAFALFFFSPACLIPARADTYTITTTADQDEALQALTDALNAQRAAMKPPVAPSTRKQVVEDQLKSAIEQYEKSYQQDVATQLLDAIRKKDAVRETELRAKLK